MPGLTFGTREFSLRPGDALLRFTDGALSGGPDARLMGEAEIRALESPSPSRLTAALLDAVTRLSGSETRDDVAILALRYTGPAET